MLPKNSKSFTLGYTQAVTAQQKVENESVQPSIVILGCSTSFILTGADTLLALRDAIDFALATTEE